jgi:RNA polymerase sigma-70 factor (ECF subfamily)
MALAFSDELARLETFLPAANRISITYAAHGEVADLYQEILMQLWRSRRHFDCQSAYSTWAYRVALNTAIDHVRRDRHRRATLERFRLLARRESFGETVFPLSQEAQVIKDFVETLDIAERSLFTLYLEGLEHTNISEILGISAGACRTRLSRLKEKFKQHLKGVDLEH